MTPTRSLPRSLILLGLVWSAPKAWSQEAQLGARLDPATRAAVEAVIDSARAAGLPTAPLVAKALEGAAKHAPGERIASALRSLAADLATARSVFGADADPADLAAGATLLRVGVESRVLGDIRAARRAEGVSVPLDVLTTLIGRGVPVDTAAGVVLALAQQHATDAEYARFTDEVRKDIAAGVPPGAAVAARVPTGATIGGGSATSIKPGVVPPRPPSAPPSTTRPPVLPAPRPHAPRS
jgi:hypothetical protein